MRFVADQSTRYELGTGFGTGFSAPKRISLDLSDANAGPSPVGCRNQLSGLSLSSRPRNRSTAVRLGARPLFKLANHRESG